MENKDLQQFIEKIIQDKGLAIPSEEVKKQLIDDMSQRLLDLIDREVIAAMTDENASILNQMLDNSASDREVQAFIQSAVPNAQQISAQTMTRFRDAYLSNER